MKKIEFEESGFLNVFKPPGMTSHDVVDCLRRRLRPRKLGHGGTLDPLACGVLVCLANKATRLSTAVAACEKTYVAEARTLIGPLLSVYNREVGTRHRLTIPAKRKLEPKLPPQSAKLFKRFTALANKSGLHPLDWRRFYEFVRDSRMRRPLPDEDMARLLIKEGFPEQYACDIAAVYSHLWEFKQLV